MAQCLKLGYSPQASHVPVHFLWQRRLRRGKWGRGRAPLIRSAFWPLCFNDFGKLFVALGDGDASVSTAALRKAGSLVPPRLGALPVSFGIPTIRHQNLYLTDVHGVTRFGRREFAQIATYGKLAAATPRLLAMDARELREKAMYYRRVARSVSDEAIAKALLEVAAEYDSLADRLERNRTDPEGSQQ
jgi:hypothetical protein